MDRPDIFGTVCTFSSVILLRYSRVIEDRFEYAR